MSMWVASIALQRNVGTNNRTVLKMILVLNRLQKYGVKGTLAAAFPSAIVPRDFPPRSIQDPLTRGSGQDWQPRFDWIPSPSANHGSDSGESSNARVARELHAGCELVASGLRAGWYERQPKVPAMPRVNRNADRVCKQFRHRLPYSHLEQENLFKAR